MSFRKNAPEEIKKTTLEIEEDISFFKKEIIFQRIGWVSILLVLIFGAFGLFGTGMLSREKKIINHVTLTYEKFLRFEHKGQLILQLQNSPSVTTVSIPLNYLRHIAIENVTPQPQTQQAAAGNMIYKIATGGKAEIRIFIKPLKTGSYKGSLVINNESLPFSHFVYP